MDLTAGLHYDISFKDYCEINAVSKSGMVGFNADPAGQWSHNEAEPSKVKTVGTLVHTLLLEPSNFNDEYIIGPTKTKTTKAWQESQKADKRIHLLQSELDSANAICEAVHANPDAMAYLSPSITSAVKTSNEVTAFWLSEDGYCKARYDLMQDFGRGNIRICDLKTTGSVNINTLTNTFVRYKYAMQQAFYQDSGKELGYNVFDEFPFICVSTTGGAKCVVIHLDKASVDRARQQYKAIRSRLAVVLATGRRPAPVYSKTLELPEHGFLNENL